MDAYLRYQMLHKNAGDTGTHNATRKNVFVRSQTQCFPKTISAILLLSL